MDPRFRLRIITARQFEKSRARYLKEVDAQEVTLRFWQEIYDERGKLIEVHEKYSVYTGHRKV